MTELLRHRPSDPIALGGQGARTASAFAALAGAIADALGDHAPGSRFVLACQDRYYFAAGLVALWQKGFVAALPPNGQPETVRALSRAPWSKGLLRDRDDDVGLDVRELDATAREANASSIRVEVPRHATAVVAYTSGSTGAPVAHEKTLAQLVDETLTLIATFDLTQKRVVASVPPYHLYGLLFGVLVPLLGGGAMTRTSPLQPPEVVQELAKHGADVLVAVPPHLAALAQALESGAIEWPKVTRVFSSGAPLLLPVDQTLRARGVTVTQVLGSTETGGIAHRDEAGTKPWSGLPGVRVSVGEGDVLCVASPWSSREPNALVQTADRVRLVADGFVHIGRADQVVKVGGRRIDLGDIEARLRAHPSVRDARVLALETKSLRGVELCAVVEADPAEVTVEALKQTLSAELDPVTLPRRYRIVNALPRTAAGKVEKTALLSLFDMWELKRELLEDGAQKVTIPENYGYFRGHFEEQPILPGVVQLEQIALQASRERFPELRHLARVTRVKFRRPIVPGDELIVKVERKGELAVSFDIRCGTEPAASGVLHFRSAQT